MGQRWLGNNNFVILKNKMKISVASGKGGVGKTTVAVGLAETLAFKKINVQFLDCDVEEPNSYFFIKPQITQRIPIYTQIPQVDKNKCNFCAKCAKICAYNAIAVIKTEVLIFDNLCHGCGACSFFCPQKAIKEVNKEIGFIEIGEKENLKFIHGKLKIGQAIPVPLIKAVKKYMNGSGFTIIDAPPGANCSVVESVKKTDFCILITEPTPFGLNDMMQIIELLKNLDIKFGVVINKENLGDKRVENFCKRNNIPILMKIPFLKKISSQNAEGLALTEILPEYKEEFYKVVEKVKNLIQVKRGG